MKNIKKISLIFSLIILFSCNEEVNDSIDIQNQLSISILNNTLKFENNDYLKESLEKNNKENLNSNLRKFRKQGFKALRPIFDLNDNDAIDLFLSEKRKRLKNNKILYSKESENDDDIDLDDELIADDSFASILNEEREVYVGDKFYKYTTIGLFYCKIENEAHLRNYLDNIENTAEGKLFIKNKLTQKSFNSNCNPEIVNLMAPEGSFNEVDDMITLFIPELSDCNGNGDGNTGGGSGTGTGGGSGTGSYTPTLTLIVI